MRSALICTNIFFDSAILKTQSVPRELEIIKSFYGRDGTPCIMGSVVFTFDSPTTLADLMMTGGVVKVVSKDSKQSIEVDKTTLFSIWNKAYVAAKSEGDNRYIQALFAGPAQ